MSLVRVFFVLWVGGSQPTNPPPPPATAPLRKIRTHHSIAAALQRPFERVSLGGVSDELKLEVTGGRT